MKFDNILANPPYDKIGVEITNIIINEIPYKDISILGTRPMLGKHNERLALGYVYIEDYILEPPTKCKWVSQLVMLGHKGSCNVIPATCDGHNGKIRPNELRVTFSSGMCGRMCQSLEPLLTRNRETSWIISVSDEDYEYIKKHWDRMDCVERFWWMHDHGLYKQFMVEK